MRSGFTLIELMVVVVLVMILALAIVPSFRDIINKSKYTEGSSAISALRTNIKVFYTDNTRLPGLDPVFVNNPATTHGCSPDLTTANVNYDTVGLADSVVQTLCSQNDQEWLITASDPAGDQTFSRVAGVASYSGVSPLQRELNIAFGDYAGAYFKNEDYQYLIIDGGKGSSTYGYAIAVTAGTSARAPTKGTGYAVMEVYNPTWYQNQLLTGTWERYSAEPPIGAGNIAGQLYLQLTDDATSALDKQGNVIVVPTWTLLTTAGDFQTTTTDMSGAAVIVPDIAKMTVNLGWKFQ